jgi:hypothetical protein
MASLTGLARIASLWRELIGFFRNAGSVRVKYAMLVRAITHGESRSARWQAMTDGQTPGCPTHLHDTTETLLTRNLNPVGIRSSK